ncbi:MAG TPA: MBL fold metallo-hydrolase [Clostridiales bacterium]|mgnify:FL=1|jgi:hydroxyacylglutathione hydrolase|nr:MBL fold metallo-hydrolase [Clostridiales bacterium]
MRRIRIKTLVLGMVQNNCYIVGKPDSNEAVVIDPGDNADKIYKYLSENDLECKAILLTHGHFDHITAAPELNRLTNAPIYAHEAEADILKDPEINASAYMGERISVRPDISVKDNEELKIAGLSWNVLYTPGHTAGGVCYYLKEHKIVFSGDTLFYESVGRTDFPTGNHKVLIESIQNKLMILPDDTEVYPGHGRPTTIGHEKGNNPYL